MAAKFKIFVDECQRSASFEPQEKLAPPTTTATLLTTTTTTTSTNSDDNNQLHETGEQQAKLSTLMAAGTNNINQQPQPPPAANQPPGKREPLGLRQPLGQAVLLEQANQHLTTSSQPPVASTTSIASSSSSALSCNINEEDQENDISMASLGSDFVPSILHDEHHFDEHSFELDDEEDDNDVEVSPEPSSGGLVDEDEDFLEDDEELKMELSQAFKQHDDSQLFKSTVYIDDIDSYLQQLERKPDLRPLPNYMDFQNEIDSDKRAILINWLVEVSDEYELQPETLFICTGIIDRFLSKMFIPTSNFQLLGVAAMFIASKYEEIYPPNLYQFVEVTDDTYSGQQICQMEQEILKTLNFRISLPTVSFFLKQIFAFNKFPKKVYNLAEYLCYLSLLADQPFLEYYPSEIALASVILAAHQLDASANISTELKNAYDKSNLDQLQRRSLPGGVKLRDLDRRVYIINKELPFCIESLRTMQERAFTRKSRTLNDTAIVHKFSSHTQNCVALLPAPKVEDLMRMA